MSIFSPTHAGRRPSNTASSRRDGGAAVVAVAACVALLAGCGGAGDSVTGPAAGLPGAPGEVIARVGPYGVTRAAFAHVFVAEAVREADTEGSTIKALPIPPHFTACVSELTKVAARVLRRRVPAALLRAKCAERYEALQQRALDRLVRDEWAIGEAARLGLRVAPADVRDRLASAERKRFATRAQLQSYLSKTGLSEDEVSMQERAKVSAERIRAKVVQPFASLSRASVKTYYETHPTLDATPLMRDIRIVRAGSSAKDGLRVKRELTSGRSFASLAKALPRQPAETKDGFKRRYESHAFRQSQLNGAIFAASPHRLVGPVKTEIGYYLIEVTRVYPRRRPPFAKVEAALMRSLPEKLQRQALSAFEADWVARWKARTRCADDYRGSPCSGGPWSSARPSIEVPDAFE